MNAGEENGIEVQAESESVAKVGDTEYATLQEILDEMEPAKITLLGNVSENNITVYAATTIDMAGFSISGSIDAADSLTLTNGTVTGNVKVDGGMFTIQAPAGAAAAINGSLNVISGSCSVGGAQVGVSGTLYFGRRQHDHHRNNAGCLADRRSRACGQDVLRRCRGRRQHGGESRVC